MTSREQFLTDLNAVFAKHATFLDRAGISIQARPKFGPADQHLIDTITDYVASAYNVHRSAFSPRKHRALTNQQAHARRLVMLFVSDFRPNWADAAITALFNLETSSLPHARRWLQDQCSIDARFKAEVARMRTDLQKVFAIATSNQIAQAGSNGRAAPVPRAIRSLTKSQTRPLTPLP